MRCSQGRAVLLIALGWVLSATCLTGVAAAQVEAYPGQPFGVASVTVTVPDAAGDVPSVAQGFFLEERDGRAHYPVFAEGPVRRLLGDLLGIQPAGRAGTVTVLFLFTGSQPLELAISAPSSTAAGQISVLPTAPRTVRAHQRLLQRWWREFSNQAGQQVQQGDYPPLVETYLTSMLSRRLQLAPPQPGLLQATPPTEPYQTLQLLAGVESLRLEMLKRVNLGYADGGQAAGLPLPPEIAWSPPPPLEVAPDVDIEPIAGRVPEECFYVRFGTFENYLWLDRLQREYGGDVSRMITLRGYDAQVSQRTQRQLGLRASALAELFGPAIVADVALIGRDLYVREGPAVGVLFQARDALLGTDLIRQRTAALQQDRAAGSREELLQIRGRPVSFVSTPDNRLRSFYAADGDFHLVTTSRAILERFLEVADSGGQGSLAQSSEFQHARTVMPTSRQDTIFVYFGAPFLQGLFSPQYQVELSRRLQAVTELESLQLAQWAALREGQPAESLADLIAGEFLPPGFGSRPDGSRATVSGDAIVDSLRGVRGSFTPVPDVQIDGITARENARLAEQAVYYGDGLKRLDPLVAGIKRYALDQPDQERVVIDAHVSPFVQEKYGWVTSIVGPPTSIRISSAAGDVITAQAVLRGGLLSPGVSPHHLFLGVQDHEPITDVAPRGLFKILAMLQSTPGYLGAWPQPGFLDRLPLGLGGGPPDAYGYSRLLLGAWRRQWDAFSVVAYDPQLLARISPQLVPEETQDLAQLRLEVGDLSQARLNSWVTALAYARAYQASLGNARLLQTLSQQLGVRPQNALSAAEQLLDADLVCSLGGEYALDEGTDLWMSTAWPETAQRPADYQAPLLAWFRGLQAQVTMWEDRVVVHAELDLQRKPAERPVQLPFFNLFGGGKPKPQTAPETAKPTQEAPQAQRESEEVPARPPAP